MTYDVERFACLKKVQVGVMEADRLHPIQIYFKTI